MKRIITLSLAILVLYACKEEPTIPKYKQLVIKDKNIDLEHGSTRYNVAFTNGESESFSFGLYSKYKIGDTVCFEQGAWNWYVINCK